MIFDFDPYGYFHFHIYFKDKVEEKKAMNLSRQLIELFGGAYNKPVNKPIGPHPYPMVEVDIGKNMTASQRREKFSLAVMYCMNHGHGLSVLIHAIGEEVDPLSAHTLEALWVGPQLGLNLSIFSK